MTAHSSVGASSAGRWMKCPGSVKLCRGLPNVSSPAAAEGTAAHWFAEKSLITGKDVSAFIGDVYKGFICTEFMAAHVQVYVDAVKEAGAGGAKLHVEAKFDLSEIFKGAFGTNDACVITEDVLHVFDLKYGRNHVVEVGTEEEPNPQLLYYALGALCKFQDARVKQVAITIVQPRAYHAEGPVRTLTLDVMQVSDFADRLVAAARKTQEAHPELVVGEHCNDYFCLARGICPAFKAVAAKEMTFGGDLGGTLVDPLSLTKEARGRVLSNMEMIEAWIKAVKEQAHQDALNGSPPEGWKLVNSRGVRRWVEEDLSIVDFAEKLGKSLGVHGEELLKPTELKSPAQVEEVLKLSGRMKPKDLKGVLAPWVCTVSSGYSLVLASDKREEVKFGSATLFAVENLTEKV